MMTSEINPERTESKISLEEIQECSSSSTCYEWHASVMNRIHYAAMAVYQVVDCIKKALLYLKVACMRDEL